MENKTPPKRDIILYIHKIKFAENFLPRLRIFTNMTQKSPLNEYSLAYMTQRYEMSSSTFGYQMVTQYLP